MKQLWERITSRSDQFYGEARAWYDELKKTGQTQKDVLAAANARALAAQRASNTRKTPLTPEDVLEQAKLLKTPIPQKATGVLNISKEARGKAETLGALPRVTLFVKECEARSIPLERTKSGKVKETMASMADKLIAWNFSTNPTTPSHLLERKNKEDQVLFDDDFLLPSHELSKAPERGNDNDSDDDDANDNMDADD